MTGQLLFRPDPELDSAPLSLSNWQVKEMVGRLVEQGKVWVDQPAVAMLLSPGFPGDQQQRQPDEQQHIGGLFSLSAGPRWRC